MHFSKPLVRLSLFIVVAELLLFVAVNPVVYADTEVSWIISSNTTWTKAGSPYSLTGNLLVDNGVTLTIEAGVHVYLNEYSLIVNGTLRAYGTETDKITFHGSKIEFTEHSSKWDKREGTGNIIEHAIFDSTTLDSRLTSLKIAGCSLYEIVIGGSSTLTYNTFNERIRGYSLDSPVISHNTILDGADLRIDGLAVVSDNVASGSSFLIEGKTTVTSNTFSHSAWIGSGTIRNNTCLKSLIVMNSSASSVVSNNTVFDSLSVSGNSRITENFVLDGVFVGSGDHVTVSNNIIKGGISVSTRSYIDASIIDNTITDTNRGRSGIYTATYSTSPIYVPTSHVDVYIHNNTISGFSLGIGVAEAKKVGGVYTPNKVVIDGNTLLNNTDGISATGKATIRNNIVAKGSVGISCNNDVLVEGNLIMNNSWRGISGEGEIRHNTIVNSRIGIDGAPKLIVGNNIYNNTEYNLQFDSSHKGNATDNWWGTTDPEAISEKIYDYYEDFYLGIVNFTPFLTEPNPQAPEVISLPEYNPEHEPDNPEPEPEPYDPYKEYNIPPDAIVWTKESPSRHLQSSVTIPKDATLYIEAGVTVNLNGNNLTVEGTLLALGTEKQPIRLTGGTQKTGLSFAGNSVVSNIIMEEGLICVGDSSKLTDSEINGKIRIQNGSPEIINNIVKGEYVSDAIIFEEHGNAKALIAGNDISGSWRGIALTVGNEATIRGNRIHDNDWGITMGFSQYGYPPGSNAIILNNTIENNAGAINVYGPSVVTITFNNIQNNEKSSVILGEANSDPNDVSRFSANDVNATYNWWGTSNKDDISQTIRDSNDYAHLGTVTFIPFLTEQNPEINPEIPEFSSWIILPMALTAMLLAVTYKKKLKRSQL